MSKRSKIELHEIPAGLTEAEYNSALAFRALAVTEKSNVFLVKLFKEHGPMTEADAAARLVAMGIYGWRIVFARLDESRGDKGLGTLRREGSKISPSTGKRGFIWHYVPPENREERRTAMLEHWQDRLTRELKARDKVDNKIKKAQARIAEIGHDLNWGV